MLDLILIIWAAHAERGLTSTLHYSGSQIVQLELSYCNGFFNLCKCALELRRAVKLVNLNCLDSENASSSWNKIALKTSNLIQIDYITK